MDNLTCAPCALEECWTCEGYGCWHACASDEYVRPAVTITPSEAYL